MALARCWQVVVLPRGAVVLLAIETMSFLHALWSWLVGVLRWVLGGDEWNSCVVCLCCFIERKCVNSSYQMSKFGIYRSPVWVTSRQCGCFH